jgi:hypothetical protein
MCFDLIKEGIVDKVQWFAHKLGIIVDDEDRVDDDHTRYANFEYDSSNQHQQQIKTEQRENSGKRSLGKTKSNDSFNEPPAYDYESADGKWLKNIRDKNESSI